MQNSERRTLKMQDIERKNEQKREKYGFIKKIYVKIKEKDEREVRQRLKLTVDFILCAVAAYFLGGAKLIFGAYPLCIALVCSSRRRMLPVVLGISVFVILHGLPAAYLFACTATVLIRALAVLLPYAVAETSNSRSTAVVLHKAEAAVVSDNESTAIDGDDIQAVGVTSKTDGQRFGTVRDKKVSQSGVALFAEELYVKAICAALGGFLCGLFLLIQGSFSFYSLCATLTLTVGCPAAVLLLGGYFGEKRYVKEWYLLMSVELISAVCVYSSGGSEILGMPMAPFLAMLMTLYITTDSGLVGGLAAAILCGITFNVVYIPLLIICAVVFFFVSAVRRNAGLAAVCAAVVVWCYYVGGADGLVKVLPPMLLAIPFYMIADKYREIIYAPYSKSVAIAGGVYFAEAVTEKNKNVAVKERLGALSEAFSALSETFYKLSDRFKRPDILGIKRIAETAFERRCDGCRNREICWGAEYSDTLEAIRCITAELHTSGTVDERCLPESFVQRCIRLEQMIGDVNAQIIKMTENIIKGDKVGFFASNYEDITSILNDALISDGEEYESDSESGKKIFEYLYEQGFRLSGTVVYGKRCKHVVVKGISLSDRLNEKKSEEIRVRIGEIVGSEMSEPIIEVGRDGAIMSLNSRPLFRVECSHGQISAETGNANGAAETDETLFVDPFDDVGDGLCGDVTNAFITESSHFYALISDGMGSGAEAAFTSGVCSMFIEKMLCAGNRADITVRMLNNVIRSENMGCGSECSATVDLLELDLISGVASFIKSGAAPTYVARGETVYKINSRTMPVGIIKDADARVTRFDAQVGDIIVMMSDGCCPDSDDCPWLIEYLCNYTSSRSNGAALAENESERLKNELLELAVKRFPNDRERDDISVSVVIIG